VLIHGQNPDGVYASHHPKEGADLEILINHFQCIWAIELCAPPTASPRGELFGTTTSLCPEEVQALASISMNNFSFIYDALATVVTLTLSGLLHGIIGKKSCNSLSFIGLYTSSSCQRLDPGRAEYLYGVRKTELGVYPRG
jgi:hypothetical protein